jgi:hypothetical protein
MCQVYFISDNTYNAASEYSAFGCKFEKIRVTLDAEFGLDKYQLIFALTDVVDQLRV